MLGTVDFAVLRSVGRNATLRQNYVDCPLNIIICLIQDFVDFGVGKVRKDPFNNGYVGFSLRVEFRETGNYVIVGLIEVMVV